MHIYAYSSYESNLPLTPSGYSDPLLTAAEERRDNLSGACAVPGAMQLNLLTFSKPHLSDFVRSQLKSDLGNMA